MAFAKANGAEDDGFMPFKAFTAFAAKSPFADKNLTAAVLEAGFNTSSLTFDLIDAKKD